ncbi:MAG: aldehyde dehydrogenase family protein [Bacteroidetes bacterium]|nr:aldehyde dehydrogenase family protein [Bacteroidota bacterium]
MKTKTKIASRKSQIPRVLVNLPEASDERLDLDKRIKVLKTYKIYIDGKFPRSESGRYYKLKDSKGNHITNMSRASRKDFRNAVVAARNAVSSWSDRTGFNRGQIIYRIAEMLETRKAQFIWELVSQGISRENSVNEVNTAIDRLVYYAGWADKYQQIFSSVNPVNASYFNFSVPEPTGVVGIIAPEEFSFIGLISNIIPAILGGNTCVVLASESMPLTAISFAEVLQSSDVPAGVVNILTGFEKELVSHFSGHMDVNAIIYTRNDPAQIKAIQISATSNLKRIHIRKDQNWMSPESQNPYIILDNQEIKTIWHPIGF